MKNTQKAKKAPIKKVKKPLTKMEKTNLLIDKYFNFLMEIYTISKKSSFTFATYTSKHKVSTSISKVLQEIEWVQKDGNAYKWVTLKPSKSIAARVIELLREHLKKSKQDQIAEECSSSEGIESNNEPIIIAATIDEIEALNANVEQLKATITNLEIKVAAQKHEIVEHLETAAYFKKLHADETNVYTSTLCDLNKVVRKSELLSAERDSLVNDVNALTLACDKHKQLLTDIKNSWICKLFTIFDKPLYKKLLERLNLSKH